MKNCIRIVVEVLLVTVLQTEHPACLVVFCCSQALCARIGGEEFAVLMPVTELEGSRQVAEAMPRLQSGARHVSKFPTAEAMVELVCDVAQTWLRVETEPSED